MDKLDEDHRVKSGCQRQEEACGKIMAMRVLVRADARQKRVNCYQEDRGKDRVKADFDLRKIIWRNICESRDARGEEHGEGASG
jgi:hypothetical protein